VTYPPMTLVPDLPEPTDEELWLEHVARQVEHVARPLFAAAWVELLRRALDADDNDRPEVMP
jgi:hypothetical protein